MKLRSYVQFAVVLVFIFCITSPLHADTDIYVPPSHPIPITQTNNVDETGPVVAYDPGRQQYLVVYSSSADSPSILYTVNATCLNYGGEIIAEYTLGTGYHPDVVYDASHDIYVAVWQNVDAGKTRIAGNYVDGLCCDGCTGTNYIITADRPGMESRPVIAYNALDSYQDLLIVWHEDENVPNHLAVWGKRMAGTTQLSESFSIIRPEDSYNYLPDVTHNVWTNEFMVVFVRDPSKGTNEALCDIYGVRLIYDAGSPSGLFVVPETAIDTHAEQQLFPRIAAYPLNLDTPYLVIYRDKWADLGGNIYGCLVNTNGICIQWVDISSQPDKIETNPSISSSEASGGYTVIWQEQPEVGDTDVRWRKISHDGMAMGSIGLVAGDPLDNSYPDIINSIPFPFAVWATRNVGDNFDIYGRFLYEKTFIPLVLRNR